MPTVSNWVEVVLNYEVYELVLIDSGIYEVLYSTSVYTPGSFFGHRSKTLSLPMY